MVDKQVRFSYAVGDLLIYAKLKGIAVTLSDAYATDGHKDNSNHYIRLAIDLNLFDRGEYVTSSEHTDWHILHNYWESSCGGSSSIKHDAGHFSFEHNGRR